MPDPVVIVQRRLTHYRVPFFEALRVALAAADFELRLVVAEPTAAERSKNDTGHIAWATQVPAHHGLGGRVCWLRLGKALRGARFVVLPQENGHLHNLPLLLAPQPFCVGLWGHGANRRSALHAPSHQLKRWLTQQANWFFAYTKLTFQVIQSDFPAARITVLNNAHDTATLLAGLALARSQPRHLLHASLGLHAGPVLIFMASLYGDKQPELAWRTAQWLHALRPDLQFVLAGDGPLAARLREQTGKTTGLPWVHMPGNVQGRQKAQWLAAADVMLNPGVVGLGVLDAFAAELPLVLGECSAQPPEFAYIEPNINSVLAPPEPAALGQAVLNVLDRPGHAAHLRQGARVAAARYTLSAMVEHFVQGMQQWRAGP